MRNLSPIGAYGMIGDVWEWTASEFCPWPGFRASPGTGAMGRGCLDRDTPAPFAVLRIRPLSSR